MNKIINKLLLALCRDVDGVVSFFDAHRARLAELAERQTDKAMEARVQAARLVDEAERHQREADRARRVAARVGDLLS